tara:strand:+ start:64 stop:501 length:438 start_codon:yes stop_codon:yes gene_type:complete
MKLSSNFTLEELTISQTALRNDIDNIPNEEETENLKQLCINILQPLRDDYQLPLVISSSFRSKELSSLVGSKPTSQHCQGSAADFTIPGVDNKKVFKHIIENLPFDQAILEYYNEDNSGWIHVSYVTSGRGQALTKDKEGYKTWQ